jgi:hypothetical protein
VVELGSATFSAGLAEILSQQSNGLKMIHQFSLQQIQVLLFLLQN